MKEEFDRLMDRCNSEAIKEGGLLLSAFVIHDEHAFPTIGIGICSLTEAIANVACLAMPEESDAGLIQRITDLLRKALASNREIIKRVQAEGDGFRG